MGSGQLSMYCIRYAARYQANTQIVSITVVYCCKIMGTIAARNKYSFLSGRDFFGVFLTLNWLTFMAVLTDRQNNGKGD